MKFEKRIIDEVIHKFSTVTARVAPGEEIMVTGSGKPALKLFQMPASELSAAVRTALVQRALSLRMTVPYGAKFERGDAYEAWGALGSMKQPVGV